MRCVRVSRMLILVFTVCLWLCLLMAEQRSAVPVIRQVEKVNRTTDATIDRVIEFIKILPDETCRSVASYGDPVSRDERDNQLPVCVDEGLRAPVGRCIVYSIYHDEHRVLDFLKSAVQLHCRLHLFNYRPKKRLRKSNATMRPTSLRIQGSRRQLHPRLVDDLEAIREQLGQADSFIDYLSVDLPLHDTLVIIRDWMLHGMLHSVKQLAVRINLDTFAQTMANYRRLYQTIRRLEDRRFYRFSVQAIGTSYGYRKAVKRYEYSTYRLTWLNVIYQQPL